MISMTLLMEKLLFERSLEASVELLGFESGFVSAEEFGDGFFPVEIVGEAVVATAGHFCAAGGIVEESDDGFGEFAGGHFGDVNGGVLGRGAGFDEIEGNLRFGKGHVFEDLVHGATVVVGVRDIAGDAEVDRFESGDEGFVGGPAGHVDEFGEFKAIAEGEE